MKIANLPVLISADMTNAGIEAAVRVYLSCVDRTELLPLE
jgi:hypothetical protein